LNSKAVSCGVDENEWVCITRVDNCEYRRFSTWLGIVGDSYVRRIPGLGFGPARSVGSKEQHLTLGLTMDRCSYENFEGETGVSSLTRDGYCCLLCTHHMFLLLIVRLNRVVRTFSFLDVHFLNALISVSFNLAFDVSNHWFAS